MVVIEETAWYQQFLKTQNQRQILRLLEHRLGPVLAHITEALQRQTVEHLDRLILTAPRRTLA